MSEEWDCVPPHATAYEAEGLEDTVEAQREGDAVLSQTL